MLRVRFSEKHTNIFTDKNVVSHYSHLEQYQGLFIFFPTKYKYVVVDEKEEADICVFGIQHVNNELVRDNELNVMICVENLSVGRGHYQHFNHYDRYNNHKMDLYYYSDISQLTQNTIPTPYCFIKQYNYLQNTYDQILKTKFEDKLFCLAISKNNLNRSKSKIITLMSQLGQVDHIYSYDNLVANKSCYNSPELLSVFNRYKFVICVENSNSNGYITEKIFNIFLAKSIPIYDGAPDVGNYINEHAFIKFDETFVKKVIYLNSNKGSYNHVVSFPKFNKNNEIVDDFEKRLESIFDSHLERKNIVPQ